MSQTQTLEEVRETICLLDSWDDKYAYLMELGDDLHPVDDALKVDAYLVEGCVSRVWLRVDDTSNEHSLRFLVDSDALIVRGLLSIVMKAVNGKSVDHILAFDLEALFGDLGLSSRLSPNRRNGLSSVIKRVFAEANSWKQRCRDSHHVVQ